MQAKSLEKLIPLCIAGAWAVTSHAQGFATKPDLHVGDRWVFHEIGSDAGKDVDRRWSREVVEIAADGVMRVRRGDGNFMSFDSAWNPRPAAHPEIGARDFEFPLKVGARWTYSSPVGERFWLQSEHEVVAYEEITVPVGKFGCFRLEGHTFYNERSYRETWFMTRWYCPAVKYMAKQHLERNTVPAYGPGTRSVLESELIRFTEGK